MTVTIIGDPNNPILQQNLVELAVQIALKRLEESQANEPMNNIKDKSL